MLFSSVSFIVFFLPCLFIAYFAVPKKFRGARNITLLVFSLAFYAFGGPKYLPLMLVSILINYICGLLAAEPSKDGARRGNRSDTRRNARGGVRRMARGGTMPSADGVMPSKDGVRRKIGVILAAAAGLGLLVWFKYAGFLSGAAAGIFHSLPVLNITLPIGISFYTFQGLSYVIDVYRGETPVQKNPLKLALYISLFPQLIAGPIVRYSTIAGEIDRRDENLTEFSGGVTRFMLGFGKKMLLANAAAEIADAAFGTPAAGLALTTAWIGALAYTAQIYFDFSAYSDMAIGLGRVFGFHFLENFNYPYAADSVGGFWRRWHISLSTWFRDYLYIPLGGNRRGAAAHIRNFAVVWLLTGFWHGAAWNFMFWGLWFLLLLLGERYLWGASLAKLPAVLRHTYTMLAVIMSWVLFRADSLPHAAAYAGAMFGVNLGGGAGLFGRDTVYYLLQYWPEWLAFIPAALPLAAFVKRRLEDRRGRSPAAYAARFLTDFGPGIFALLVFGLGYIKLVTGSFNPFIYFRF